MKARIIVVLNSKGGVGKSTVSFSLAGELHRRGHRVLVADCDIQATSMAWAHAAPDDTPLPAAVVNLSASRERLHQELRRYLDDYDFVIVDTPPYVESVSASALLVADFALVPLEPSPAALWAAKSVMALIERARKLNRALQAAIVANRVTRTALCAAALGEFGRLGIPVLQSQIAKRVAFEEALLDGTTVCALGRKARVAAAEIEALADEVLALMGEAA